MMYRTKMEVDKNREVVIIESGYEDPREPLLTRFTAQIIDCKDKLIRQGLKDLGWLPPDEPPMGSRWTMEQLEQEYEKNRKLYEELRKAIDNGHESMTHDDAVAWVRQAHQNNFRLSKLEW